MKSFGDIIRAEREKRNLFIRQVAAAMDTDQALISKFEKGTRNPSKEMVEKLAGFFNLDKAGLLTAWLSDKLVYTLQDEDNAIEALRIAEAKIEYLKQQQ